MPELTHGRRPGSSTSPVPPPRGRRTREYPHPDNVAVEIAATRPPAYGPPVSITDNIPPGAFEIEYTYLPFDSKNIG